MQLGLPGDGDRGGALPRRLSPAPLPKCKIPCTYVFKMIFAFQSVFAKHFDDILPLPRLSSVYAWQFQPISISFLDLTGAIGSAILQINFPKFPLHHPDKVCNSKLFCCDFGNYTAFVFTFPPMFNFNSHKNFMRRNLEKL